MSASVPSATGASGLTTVINTIASPSEAFESIRIAPTWGWAALIAIVLLVAGTYLQSPASQHAAKATMQVAVATSPLFANLTAAQKARAVENSGRTSWTRYLFVAIGLFLAVLLNTLIMLVGNAAGGGQADFKRLWAGSMNIAVPTFALSVLVTGIIAALRGPDSFMNSLDLVRAIPSLAMLPLHASPEVTAFLAAISVFTVWGFFLNSLMLQRTARTSAGIAYGFAAIPLILGALFGASLTAIAHSFKLV